MKGLRLRKKLRGKNMRRPKHRLVRWTAMLAFVLFVCGLVVLFVYKTWAASFDLQQLGEMPQRSIVYDFDGKVYGRLHGENRVMVKFKEVAPVFVQALLAREDTR